MKKKKLIIWLTAIALVVALAAGFVVFSFMDSKVSRELSVAEAQQILDKTLDGLPKPTAVGANRIFEDLSVTVNEVDYGLEKDVILSCSYKTLSIGDVITENKQQLIDAAYAYYYEGRQAGKMQNATKISLAMSDMIEDLLKEAKPISGDVTLYLYEITDGNFSLYLSDEAVDTFTGGLITANNAISGVMKANYNGRPVDITNSGTLRTGIKDCLSLINYDSQKPATGNALVRWFSDFSDDFYRNFIYKDRWMYLLQGLGTTLGITALAGIMGMILGFLVAIVRCTNETTGKLKLIDAVCRLYLTVVRGTPVMVQLLIIYFVLLLPIGVPKFISAVLCFGLNSGAYVAEIVRGGIMSVDKGQNEAGRSLGFNYPQTMINFIIPQAFKAVLPALANEFITLLKESSVAFYIGVADLTQGGLKIRSLTYSNFLPLIAVALIYLVIVLIMTRLVGILERRLRKSDR